MPDITSYTHDLLLDFLDGFHAEISRRLSDEFGDRWLELGVRAKVPKGYFEKAEKMLRSPMRVVDMDRDDAEIYGAEHILNIVQGNWGLFNELAEDKARTQVYLLEVSELRHNLAHLRKRNVVLRNDLVRFVQNGRILLTAVGSPVGERFSDIEDSLISGGSPWGTSLAGHLPPRDEIYSDFVGRPNQLGELSDWFSSDRPSILVWGYGGAGKSALAYKFARDVRDGSHESLDAVCWVSAKRSEFIEGATRGRPADFDDIPSLVNAILAGLYGHAAVPDSGNRESLIQELKETPVLLVVDDFDTISEVEELAEFLLYDLRNTSARVIFTSRHRVPGMKTLEAPPFTTRELEEFVELKAQEYGVDESEWRKRIRAIESVTGAYPLFVDDLIRHAMIRGLDKALEDWTQRKGDAAREYALRRQVEFLGQSCGEVLMTLSVVNRSLIVPEISEIAGLTDEDALAGIDGLMKWRLIHRVVQDDSAEPAYRMNANTSRLVQQTFKGDHRLNVYSQAYRSLSGERVPEAKRRAVARAISETAAIEKHDGFERAVEHIRGKMTGELADSSDLYGILGWLHSKQGPEHANDARDAFGRAHSLGAAKIDMYYHWGNMERRIAEDMIVDAQYGKVLNEEIATQWERCRAIAELGIDRCGPSQELCNLAGYAGSREGKSRTLANQFTRAQVAYEQARDRFRQALGAPISDVGNIRKTQIYRGLALTLVEIQQSSPERTEELTRVLTEWKAASGDFTSGDSIVYHNEVTRLGQSNPDLMFGIFNRFPNLNPRMSQLHSAEMPPS